MPEPAIVDLAHLRTDYDWGTLDEGDVSADPLEAVRTWVEEAISREVPEPGAMVVSTVGADGAPTSRTVLLRGVDTGLCFYTNRTSLKGRHLDAEPRCAALLRWDQLHRQVCVTGTAAMLDDEASDAYFASRPRSSQIGAWASRQSEVIADRSVLAARVAEAEARHKGAVPRPPFWGGYRITPVTVELWQGRPSRLHDRLRYRRPGPGQASLGGAGAWVLERLSP